MVFKLSILNYIWKYGEGRWVYQMHKTDTNMTDIFMPYCFLVIYIELPIDNCDNKGAGVMVLNATFNNIFTLIGGACVPSVITFGPPRLASIT